MSKERAQVPTDRPEVERLIRRIVDTAGPRAVFGEPVTAGERTVIPVARVAYGGGGGWGGPARPDDIEPAEMAGDADQGAGGGFGVGATPVGYIELTPDGTRFHQIVNWVPLAVGAMLLSAFGALVVGSIFGRHRR